MSSLLIKARILLDRCIEKFSGSRKLKAVGFLFLFVSITVVAFLALVEPALAESTKSITVRVVESVSESIKEAFIAVITTVMGWIITLFISLTIFFLKFVLEVAGYNGYIDSSAVTYGWVVMRDFANMFFVVILLVIALGTILGLQNYEWKKLLMKLFLAAILVNLSRVICGLIIDASQIVMLTFINGVVATAGGNLIQFFHFADLLKYSSAVVGQEAIPADFGGIFITLFLGIVFTVLAAMVIGSYLIVLLARLVVLWVLIVLSPLAFVLGVLPNTQQYASEWWKEFLGHVMVGPVLAFFLWLSFVTLGTGKVHGEVSLYSEIPEAAKIPEASLAQVNAKQLVFGQTGLSEAGTWDNMANFLIAIAMLLVGVKVAQKTGATSSGMLGSAVSFGKKVATIATGAAVGIWAAKKVGQGAGYVGKGTVGLAGKAIWGWSGAESTVERIGNWGKAQMASHETKKMETLEPKSKREVRRDPNTGEIVTDKSGKPVYDLATREVETLHDDVNDENYFRDQDGNYYNSSNQRLSDNDITDLRKKGVSVPSLDVLKETNPDGTVKTDKHGNEIAAKSEIYESESQQEYDKRVNKKSWIFAGRKGGYYGVAGRRRAKLLASRKALKKTEDHLEQTEKMATKSVTGIPSGSYLGADLGRARRRGESWNNWVDGEDRVKQGKVEAHEERSAAKTDEYKAAGKQMVLANARFKNGKYEEDKGTMSKRVGEHLARAEKTKSEVDALMKAARNMYDKSGKGRQVLQAKLKADLKVSAEDSEQKHFEGEMRNQLISADQAALGDLAKKVVADRKEATEKADLEREEKAKERAFMETTAGGDLAAREAEIAKEKDREEKGTEEVEEKAKRDYVQSADGRRVERDIKEADLEVETAKLEAEAVSADVEQLSVEARGDLVDRKALAEEQKKKSEDVVDAIKAEAEGQLSQTSPGEALKEERAEAALRKKEAEGLTGAAESEAAETVAKANVATYERIKEDELAKKKADTEVETMEKEAEAVAASDRATKKAIAAAELRAKKATGAIDRVDSAATHAVADPAAYARIKADELGKKAYDEGVSRIESDADLKAAAGTRIGGVLAKDLIAQEELAKKAAEEDVSALDETVKARAATADPAAYERIKEADLLKKRATARVDTVESGAAEDVAGRRVDLHKAIKLEELEKKTADSKVSAVEAGAEKAVAETDFGRGLRAHVAAAEQRKEEAEGVVSKEETEAKTRIAEINKAIIKKIEEDVKAKSSAENIVKRIKSKENANIYKESQKELDKVMENVKMGTVKLEDALNSMTDVGAKEILSQNLASYFEDKLTQVEKDRAMDRGESMVALERTGNETPSSATKKLVSKMEEAYSGTERERAAGMAANSFKRMMLLKSEGKELDADQQANFMALQHYLVKRGWSDDLLARLVEIGKKADDYDPASIEGKEAKALKDALATDLEWDLGFNSSKQERTNDMQRLMGFAGDTGMLLSENAVLMHSAAHEGLEYDDAAKDLAERLRGKTGGDLDTEIGNIMKGMKEIQDENEWENSRVENQLRTFHKRFIEKKDSTGTVTYRSADEARDKFIDDTQVYGENSEYMTELKPLGTDSTHIDDTGHSKFNMEKGYAHGMLPKDSMRFMLGEWVKVSQMKKVSDLKIHAVMDMDEVTNTAHKVDPDRYSSTFTGINTKTKLEQPDTRNKRQLLKHAADEKYIIDDNGKFQVGSQDSKFVKKDYIERLVKLSESSEAKDTKFAKLKGDKAAIEKLANQAAARETALDFAVMLETEAAPLVTYLAEASGSNWRDAMQGNFDKGFEMFKGVEGVGAEIGSLKDLTKWIRETIESTETDIKVKELNKRVYGVDRRKINKKLEVKDITLAAGMEGSDDTATT